jgi:ketosteroid isomerase-like protein
LRRHARGRAYSELVRGFPLAVLFIAFAAMALPHPASSQRQESLPRSLETMVQTERAFAARALVVGWKKAFLEYFSDSAVGFDEGGVGYAKDQISKNPDPPKDLQLLWDPRYGDIAGSGDLGYLTGPSRTILPSRNKGQPRHAVYASVWKRQRNGTFKVVMDVGVPTPRAAPFPAEFTRAPHSNRFTGDYNDRTPPLSAAEGIMNSALRSSQVRAYRGRLAPGARLHRPNVLPLTGDANVLGWLASQPAYAMADTRFAEASRSGDLGYSWGNYVLAARRGSTGQTGFYVRVWVREQTGQWKVALDVLQPQQGGS